MPTAAVKRFWTWLTTEHPACQACGRIASHIHHIIHVNWQRITKDDWLVVHLCPDCHQYGEKAVHRLGGDGAFYEATGIELVHRAVLNRHNFEVKAR